LPLSIGKTLQGEKMKRLKRYRDEVNLAKAVWGDIGKPLLQSLIRLLNTHHLSVSGGDLLLIAGRWYVTHAGLLRIAVRKQCSGMCVLPVKELCDTAASRYTFCATVYTSPDCRGFMGYGDADPSNVSPLVHGAEMRVAETRAVNRALRKAYGIGICSVEEIGSVSRSTEAIAQGKRLPPQAESVNGRKNGTPPLRDHLCQIIRQHQLDPVLVKAYAVDFCGTKTLRDASRDQVENFVAHLADWAERDRNALLCQLNSYLGSREGAA
jgi:hypothetical protein